MKNSNIERQKDGTIKINISVTLSEIDKSKKEVIAELMKTTEIAGFRKGKAPQHLVEKSVNQNQVREKILKKILPKAYMEAVKEHNLQPVMSPKINLEKVEEGKDWELIILTCEMPEISLGDYKKSVQTMTGKSKIIIPGKEEKKPGTNEVVKVVLDNTRAQIPLVLIEQEADKLLSQLLNEIKKLGLNLDQYLSSTRRTPEDLRKEYRERAEQDIKLEFVLQKIAETEKITVGDMEIREAIDKAKNPDEKKNLESNQYLLTSILRQQKTLDFLLDL